MGPIPDGGALGPYRPLDNRVIEKLIDCDSFRYYGHDWNRWQDRGRKEFMNARGMKDGDDDPFLEAHQKTANERYHAWVPEMASRIQHAMRKDPHAQVAGIAASDIRDAEERAELEAEARHALENDPEAVIVWDEKVGAPRVK